MKHISPSAFSEVLQTEKNNTTIDFINVCTSVEYKEKHINGVRSVPLDELEKHLGEFADKKTIYIHCRSGARGRRAIEILTTLGVQAELVNVEGGILGWEESGYPTNFLTKVKIPLMRQVFLTAGLLVFISSIFGFTVSQNFFFITIVVGAGLTISGITGWCGMAIMLSKMPWNK